MSPVNIFNSKPAAEENPSLVPPVQPIGTPQINSAPGVVQSQPVTTPPAKKKFPKILIIAGVVLLVCILAFAVFSLINKNKKTTKEITWWGLWENQNVVEPIIASYESSHPDVKITYIEQSKEDYRERLTNALAKGNGPDIFSFHNTWVPMFKSSLDALPSTVMTATDFSQKFYPVITSDMSYGNSIVGIPMGYDAITLFINQDIFDKAGKTPPTTWNDLRKLAKELTIKDENGIIVQSGASLGEAENVDHWQEILGLLMIQNGVNLGNPTNQNAEDALTFYTNFSTVDGVWDTTLPPSTQYFAAGKLAMYFAPSWRFFEIKDKNPDLKFKTIPLPQVAKDDPLDPDMSYATYWAQGVWSKSPNKEASWDFLKYLTSTDSLQKLYQNESGVRNFGQAYPLVEMSGLIADHPFLGSIVSLAPNARSWYLASRTFDGETGINTQISNYFKDAINAINSNEKTAAEALATVSEGVAQVLAQYGITVR